MNLTLGGKMKKITVVLLALFAAQGIALAAERGTPEYIKLKEYKNKQRAEREAEKANPTPKTPQSTFWSREAERSGFAGTGAMFANGINNLVPLDKLNSGKDDK